MTNLYDYIIIGGGPSGLILSYYLSKKNYKVLLLESSLALGGCHRVLYNDNGLHTEHSPRIYVSSFYHFFDFLDKELNIKIEDSFVPYIFQFFNKQLIKFFANMDILDMSKLYLIYLKSHVIKIKFSLKYTVKDFVQEYNFGEKSIKILNNFCNLIDGGDIDKTLLVTFLDSIDKLSIYKILQPNEPMNKLIFSKFEKKLLEQKTDIILGQEVISIKKNGQGYQVFTKKNDYLTNKLILAIPPFAINKINNAVNLLGYDQENFTKWCNYSLYKDYISFSFEFDTQIESTKNVHGGISEHVWAEYFIDMSYYFKNQKGSLIILTISNLDNIDPILNKTANQLDRQELINRVKDILKQRLKINIEPIKYDMSPNIKKINGRWIEHDRSFLLTDQGILRPRIIPQNIYTVGHHNGYSHHKYNTIESAFINSLIFLNSVEDFKFKLLIPTPLSNIILILILIILYIHMMLMNNID